MKGSDIPIRKVSTGRKRWMLDLRYVGGKREFYETEDEAKGIREQKLIDLRKFGSSALSLSHADRLEFTHARDELQEIGLTIRDAVEFCKKHHRSVESISFSAAIERVYNVKAGSKKDTDYVRKFRSNLLSLMRSSGGDRELSKVTRDEIEKWLFENGWRQDTIRNKRIDVRTFFSYALNRHWITANPAEHLERVERTGKPPGILTVKQCERLMKVVAKDDLRFFLPYVTLALFCGIRPEELAKLTTENVQIERGYVEVPAFRGDVAIAKSRKRRIVELSENAREWLKLNAKISPKPEKWYARQLPRVQQAAGLLTSWPKNCLRHSFASYHLAMFGSADKTAVQMGHHSTDMLFRHYRELVTKDDAVKFWRIKP